MGLASPLVCERVWLDKPKYDAAERRYYEKLAQSLASSKVGDLSTDSKSSEVPVEQEVIDDVCISPQAQQNEPLKPLSDTCVIKPKESVEENVCKRPTEGSVCKKNNKTTQEKAVNKQAKGDEPSICSIPLKEKSEKNANEMSEPVCQKPKAANKQEKSKKNLPTAAENIDSLSEVLKQKGFDLHLKPLISLPDASLTKGTNVNTIPELTNLSSHPEKSKTSNQVKKLNQLNRVPTLDKQESTDLIIPTSIITTTTEAVPVDDQAKKDSKKKKKNKKERHRDNKKGVTQNTNSWNSLAGEVAKARQHIKNSLQCIDDIAVTSNTVSIEVANRVVSLEKENQELTGRMEKLEARIAALEKQLQQAVSAAAAVTTSAPGPAKKVQPAAPKPPAKQSNDDDDDDGVDLFASDSEEEDAEAARIKEQRLAEYAAKKSKKPALIAKSSIILDVKPWDDETDMKKMEEEVRKIATDGLLWGASKLVPLAYGIHKLQINCVVEDEKVSIDWLQETIQEIEDYVQSVDIAAFNKI